MPISVKEANELLPLIQAFADAKSRIASLETINKTPAYLLSAKSDFEVVKKQLQNYVERITLREVEFIQLV